MKRVLDPAEERIYRKGVMRRGVSVRVKGKTIFYRCNRCGSISQRTHKYLDEAGIKRLLSWHSEEKGGCTLTCKPCGRKVVEDRYGKGNFRF